MPRWVKQTEATVVLVAPSTSVCQGAREVPCVSRPAAGLAQTTESRRNPLPSEFKWVRPLAVAIPGFHSLHSCLTNASGGAFLSGQSAGSHPPPRCRRRSDLATSPGLSKKVKCHATCWAVWPISAASSSRPSGPPNIPRKREKAVCLLRTSSTAQSLMFARSESS